MNRPPGLEGVGVSKGAPSIDIKDFLRNSTSAHE